MYKISVIIPIHNSEKFLESSILSVREQTLKDIEIILVENGSTDNSLALCQDIALQDDRIRVAHLDKGDVSTARNEGVKMASAEYVGFVDSDDIVSPEMFDTLYKTAIENKLDVVTCNYVKCSLFKPDKYKYCEDGTTHIVSPKEMVCLNLLERIPQSAWAMLVRKNILEQIPFPSGKYFEDRSTTFKFIAAARRCGYINKSLYQYYLYKGSICRSKSFKRNHDFAEADLERLRFIQESGMFEKEEICTIAEKSADSLLRKILRITRSASSPEEREMVNAIKKQVTLIPKGTRLSLKSRLILFFIRKSKKTNIDI